MLRLVIVWKLIKGTVLLAAATMLTLPGDGALRLARRAAVWLSHGVGSGSLARLGALLDRQPTAGGIEFTAALAGAISALMFVEAIGLHYRRRWAAWMTVVLTSLLIPPEIYELVRHPRWPGVIALLLNALIVSYLYRKVRRDASLWREPAHPTPPVARRAVERT